MIPRADWRWTVACSLYSIHYSAASYTLAHPGGGVVAFKSILLATPITVYKPGLTQTEPRDAMPQAQSTVAVYSECEQQVTVVGRLLTGRKTDVAEAKFYKSRVWFKVPRGNSVPFLEMPLISLKLSVGW